MEEISGREARQRARWENKLMRMRRLTSDSTTSNMKYFRRFVKHDDGSVTENGWSYNTEYSAESWTRRLAERRHPDSKRSFVGDTTPIFLGDDRSWPLRKVVCSRCGETRQFAWQLDPTTVKDGWCKK